MPVFPSNFKRDFFSVVADTWRKLKAFNVYSIKTEKDQLLYVICYEFILFVGQLYKDKSHVDFFFTAELKNVNNYSTNHCYS